MTTKVSLRLLISDILKLRLQQKRENLQPPFSITYNPTAPLLAASYRTSDHDIFIARVNDLEYIKSEIGVDRLNEIHDWLWIVGRPIPPRALHLQIVEFREICITEQADLHLVWSPRRIFIKPVPRFLLDAEFWEKHLCHNYELYKCALGFLLSYTALIKHESDYNIAINKHLLPEEVTWSHWILLVEQLLGCRNLTDINKRYIYGELRLGRLNLICRLGKGRIRGYLSYSTTYSNFFQDNIRSFITLFAYITIVLSAMQVGLGTRRLQANGAFHGASFVFVVFSIVAPLILITAVVALLAGLFFYNLVLTMTYHKKRLSILQTSKEEHLKSWSDAGDLLSDRKNPFNPNLNLSALTAS